MRIAIYAFNGISTFHLSTPLLTFGEVERQHLAADWQLVVFSDEGDVIRSAEGLSISGLEGLDTMDDASVIVFPSWKSDFTSPSEEMLSRVQAAHTRGAQLIGLCLGAFPLVASGVLNGRRVATHWAAADELSREFQLVEVDANALYVDHGDVMTSAGTASGLDACLHLVRTKLGSTAAAAIARHIVIAPHRDGGQAQYIERPILDTTTGPIGETAMWALENLDQRFSVDDLARQARMSTRNFSRRFREVMGASPAKWLTAKRLEEACRMLEETDWSIDTVARRCGFFSSVTFRQNFVEHYTTTPTSYRRRFNSSL